MGQRGRLWVLPGEAVPDRPFPRTWPCYTGGVTETGDLERLKEIRDCLLECEQEVTDGALVKQFRYETKRDPDPGLLRRIRKR